MNIPVCNGFATANPPTKNLDLTGFDSSRFSPIRGWASPDRVGFPQKSGLRNLRPADFLSDEAGEGKPRVFVDGLMPADVQQGQLGNCWFMCSVAALAEFPNLISNLYLQVRERRPSYP